MVCHSRRRANAPRTCHRIKRILLLAVHVFHAFCHCRKSNFGNVRSVPDSQTWNDSFLPFKAYKQALSEIKPDELEKKAWELLLQNKLENMTACGHFADVFTWHIYFGSKEDAQHSAHSIKLNSVPLHKRPMKFLKKAKKNSQHKNYLVRVEIDDKHVYLLDIPAKPKVPSSSSSSSSSTPFGYKVESSLFGKDCSVCPYTLDEFSHHVAFEDVESLDKFTVYEYDTSATFSRITKNVQSCWGDESLKIPVIIFHSEKTWNDVLDFVDNVNSAVHVTGVKGAWHSAPSYISA